MSYDVPIPRDHAGDEPYDELPLPEPGSRWQAPESACTYRILDEPPRYGGMVLALIESSPWRARGRRGAAPLAGDRVYLRREDFGVRLHPAPEKDAPEVAGDG